jgi:hypothetical protein
MERGDIQALLNAVNDAWDTRLSEKALLRMSMRDFRMFW